MEQTADILAIIRDAIIILVFLTAGITLFLIYRMLAGLLSSAKRTLKNAEEVTSAVSSKIVGPAAAGSGVAFGAGKLAAFVLGFSRKKKGKEGKGGKNDG